jgi:hypothetical protein
MTSPRYLKKRKKKFLQNLYHYYNEKYFSNSLPLCPVRWTKKKEADYGWLDFNVDRDGKAVNLKIFIRQEFRKGGWLMIAAQTLLHEMIHVELRDDKESRTRSADYHGPKFKKRMRQLLRGGAFDNII